MNFITRTIQFVSPYIFPSFCFGCKKEGDVLCQTCIDSLPIDMHFFDEHTYIDGIYVCYNLEEVSLLRSCIHALKYQFVESICSRLLHAIKQCPVVPKDSVLCPIPLHKRRLAERGYNQAKLIADIFSNVYSFQVQELLFRKMYTKQQAKLNREKRLKNMDGVFSLKKNNQLPRSVLLVDDVYTTGATLEDAARALKENGVKQVYGLVLAHGE